MSQRQGRLVLIQSPVVMHGAGCAIRLSTQIFRQLDGLMLANEVSHTGLDL